MLQAWLNTWLAKRAQLVQQKNAAGTSPVDAALAADLAAYGLASFSGGVDNSTAAAAVRATGQA